MWQFRWHYDPPTSVADEAAVLARHLRHASDHPLAAQLDPIKAILTKLEPWKR